MTTASAKSSQASESKRAKPSLRERQKEFTRDRLLEAAVVVFADRGYASATIDDIASEAGVNRGTVYLHFQNKRDVADALFQALQPSAKTAIADLDEILTQGSRSAIRDWLHRQLDWYEEHRGTIIALENVILEGGFEGAGLGSIHFEMMPQLRARWPERRHPEVQMRLWLLTHMMSRVFILGRVDGMLPEVEETLTIDLMADLWMAGMHVGEAELPPAPRKRAAN